MKVFIPSFGRAGNIRTHKMCSPNDEVHIVVHTEEEAKFYRKNPSVNRAGIHVHVSNAPTGVCNQRNWIIDNLAEMGEWFLMADDNIDSLTGVQNQFYEQEEIDKEINPKVLAGIFKKPMSWSRFMECAKQDMTKADELGFKFIGYATNQNPFFRTKKYRTAGYVTTKLAWVKKTSLRFEKGFLCHDDFQFSCENVLRFGGVLINNFVFPLGPHYETGGIGPNHARVPYKIKEDKWLMEAYPGLIRYRQKPGVPLEAEVNFRIHSPEQIKKWRLGLACKRGTDVSYLDSQLAGSASGK